MAGLARSLDIKQQAAVSKGTELLRLLKLKMPGGLGMGEICRPAVCLEIACSIVPGSKLPLRQEFVRYSCAPAKVYNEVYTKVQSVLNVQRQVDVFELVTLFGCSDLQEQVQQLLRMYKARYLERLGASAARSAAVSQQDAKADFARPVFLAAAFSLVAKWRRTKVDKASLLKKMGVAQRDFVATVEDMTELCAEMQDNNGSAAGPRGGATCGAASNRKGGPQSGWPAGPEPAVQQEDVALEAFKLVIIGKHNANAVRLPWAEKSDDADPEASSDEEEDQAGSRGQLHVGGGRQQLEGTRASQRPAPPRSASHAKPRQPQDEGEHEEADGQEQQQLRRRRCQGSSECRGQQKDGQAPATSQRAKRQRR